MTSEPWFILESPFFFPQVGVFTARASAPYKVSDVVSGAYPRGSWQR